ncbi:hypothetical protein PENSPDRAFT_691199, partial [Peniophora sp. CONT]
MANVLADAARQRGVSLKPSSKKSSTSTTSSPSRPSAAKRKRKGSDGTAVAGDGQPTQAASSHIVVDGVEYDSETVKKALMALHVKNQTAESSDSESEFDAQEFARRLVSPKARKVQIQGSPSRSAGGVHNSPEATSSRHRTNTFSRSISPTPSRASSVVSSSSVIPKYVLRHQRESTSAVSPISDVFATPRATRTWDTGVFQTPKASDHRHRQPLNRSGSDADTSETEPSESETKARASHRTEMFDEHEEENIMAVDERSPQSKASGSGKQQEPMDTREDRLAGAEPQASDRGPQTGTSAGIPLSGQSGAQTTGAAVPPSLAGTGGAPRGVPPGASPQHTDGAGAATGAQSRSVETGAAPPGASQTRRSQTGASQTGASQTGASQTGASQTGAPQAGSSHAGGSQFNPQTGASQTGAPQAGSSQAGGSHFNSQAGSSQAGGSQFNPQGSATGSPQTNTSG